MFDETKKQECVRENYLALAESWKGSKIKPEILDGNRPIEVVHEDVKRIVEKDLGRLRQARPSRRVMD